MRTEATDKIWKANLTIFKDTILKSAAAIELYDLELTKVAKQFAKDRKAKLKSLKRARSEFIDYFDMIYNGEKIQPNPGEVLQSIDDLIQHYSRETIRSLGRESIQFEIGFMIYVMVLCMGKDKIRKSQLAAILKENGSLHKKLGNTLFYRLKIVSIPQADDDRTIKSTDWVKNFIYTYTRLIIKTGFLSSVFNEKNCKDIFYRLLSANAFDLKNMNKVELFVFANKPNLDLLPE